MMYKRELNLGNLLDLKSFFLFGPRSTGKSFWIKETLSKSSTIINLLNSQTFLRLSEDPSMLREMISHEKSSRVVIDEVQKLPILLDEVHQLIEDFDIRFLLTGSSARKLKRDQANMLGGRAAFAQFFPLSFLEIPSFDLSRYLSIGGLPRVQQSKDPELELDSYLTNYLEQEIKAESYVRNLVPFSRFLKTAAINNGELINYSNVASDTGIPASTVREYYSLLEDTLLGFSLEPWMESKKRKAIQTAKFYLFDTGVTRYILGLKEYLPETTEWGNAFEQFIGMELKCFLSYKQIRKKLCFWRNTSKHEVDYIIGNDIGIEVKSCKKIQKKHLYGFKALQEEKIIKDYYMISLDPIDRTLSEGIVALHWRTFLDKLWKGEII